MTRKGKAQSAAPTSDRYRGCLLGGALGDALGYPVEFKKAMLERVGKAPPPRLAYEGKAPARISDDTQMTLFTSEGMIRARRRMNERGICSVPGIVLFAYRRWLATQRASVLRDAEHDFSELGWLVTDRRLWSARAPGETCRGSLAHFRSREAGLGKNAVPTIENPPPDLGAGLGDGCGAVMRAAPCGLGATSRSEAFRFGMETGVLTHWKPKGYLPAGYLSALVFDLVRGRGLPEAMADADPLLQEQRGHESTARLLAKARGLAKQGPPTPERMSSLGGGWKGDDALAMGVYAALTADLSTSQGIQEALWRAVFHGGDSDSTGSIAGNLIGAIAGAERLPQGWLEELELRDVAERLARDHYAITVENGELPEYPPN